MNDHERTREQLIRELEDLRRRLEGITDGREGGTQDFAAVRDHLVFLRGIIDAVPLPVFAKDRSGCYRFCNVSFEKYVGLPRDEILGRTDYDINPQRIADPYHEMDTILLESGGTQDYEVYFRDPGGNSQAVLFNKACLTEADGSVSGLVGVITDMTDRKVVEEEKKELISRLHKALAEIKTLSGLLPICSYCGKVRDDHGYWSKIEKYVQEHSETQFSHGICPDCLKKNYPEHYEKRRRSE
jgi:PAS domain S-box-containing protein